VKFKSVCFFMTVCLLMVFGRAGSAQEVQPLEPDWLRQMYEEGWQKVREGVLRRDLGEGRLETFGYGAEGYQWLIEKYSQQLTYFEGKYRESPTAELASLIDRLQDKINTLQDDVLAAPATESFDGGQIEGCTLSYDYTADAGPLSATQGVTATASAYFHNTCPETGSTFAYAYAHAAGVDVIDTVTQEDPEYNGTWIDSYASASIAGSMDCESRSQASVEIPAFGIYYVTPEATNYSCPDIVSITGPSQVLTDYYGPACADVTWTANTASGRTDYTFEWYIGANLEGTGPTLTKRYCNETTSVTVRVVARDNDGRSYEAPPFTTNITYLDRIIVSVNGPSTVNTDYYGSPCATVTWTASAGGGHSGYTYNWYIGTGTTSLGTGSTFSKQYCNTSQTVNVKAVATASDGHSDSSIKTTDIVYRPQLTASVSGPATATTDYYGPTCVNVTWTASAAGGHPGYTYKWYLGTSTTVQGTGSTFSKQYCSTSQSVTVKAVATDSDGHTATSASFTTSIQYRPAIVAQIAGPATVSMSTPTSCVNVTWTASASGSGHSGYSYKWYLGTGTTVQGTGGTFTKSYCSATTVTVKLVATASDGHSDDVTFNTNIVNNPPTVSISGPTSIDVYSGCQTRTWTSTVSGGTPAYTYSWTIGTSTTVLSVTSSLTMTVCTIGTLNVKLTVRDSASRAANATFTTNVIEKEPIERCPPSCQ
jgi:hypothetical protein